MGRDFFTFLKSFFNPNAYRTALRGETDIGHLVVINFLFVAVLAFLLSLGGLIYAYTKITPSLNDFPTLKITHGMINNKLIAPIKFQLGDSAPFVLVDPNLSTSDIVKNDRNNLPFSVVKDGYVVVTRTILEPTKFDSNKDFVLNAEFVKGWCYNLIFLIPIGFSFIMCLAIPFIYIVHGYIALLCCIVTGILLNYLFFPPIQIKKIAAFFLCFLLPSSIYFVLLDRYLQFSALSFYLVFAIILIVTIGLLENYTQNKNKPDQPTL